MMRSVVQKNKLTSILLALITLGVLVYISISQGVLGVGSGHGVILEEQDEVMSLNVQENTYIGINEQQIIKVTPNGIGAYDFSGEEIWSDTLSMTNYIVMQKEPYIAIGTKGGRDIVLFNNKGRVAEIQTEYPIVYFSLNKNGCIATIQEAEDAHIISAYDENGMFMISRTSYGVTDGYPTVVEMSPNNKLLLASYVSVTDPTVTSRIIAIDVSDKETEEVDNINYGKSQKDNLVYEIEFIKDNVWVSIGDKQMIWYDLEGNELFTKQKISSVFTPALIKSSQYGKGYLPMVITDDPTQSIVHRQDYLVYFNSEGAKSFEIGLENPAQYFYADDSGVVIGDGTKYVGYNKLGVETFKYTPNIDISKVYYLQELRKGIAVNKEKVILLKPKKEG